MNYREKKSFAFFQKKDEEKYLQEKYKAGLSLTKFDGGA